MHFSRSSAAAALVAALPLALAQTSTDCNPLNGTCPSDTGLSTSSFNTDFTQGSSSNTSWSAATGTTINYASDGAEFTINKAGQAPTIQSDFYIFFGRVEVKMKAAPGTGIVSSVVLESDDLDEIDWEFLGGNTAQVETNFFGKGNTTAYDRAIYYSVSTPQDTFHTYTIDWTQDRLQYIIDGTIVRTLEYTDSLTNGGNNYPQTPMRVKLGNWAGGAEGEPEGTVEWAGGQTDFSKSPFTMVVASVSITNYNPGSSYEYTDTTGSYESIKVTGGSDVSGSNSSSSSSSSSSVSGSSSATATTAHSTSSPATSSGTVPTSSISVAPLMNTNAVVSTTLVGSTYSTNTESIAAQNTATTGVASQPTATESASTASTSSSQTTTAGSATQTGAAASLDKRATALSLLGMAAAGFWML